MEEQVSMFVMVCTVLPFSVLGLQLEIINQPSSGDKIPVTINCYEDDIDRPVIGDIQSLGIEIIYIHGAPLATTPPSIIRRRQSLVKYVIKPLVKLQSSGSKIWGDGFNFRNRSTVSGTIRRGGSTLSLNIRYTTCSDNLILMCVAAGTRGTVDSERKMMQQNNQGAPVLGLPVIRGGRRSPNTDQDYNDRCDVYASVGDSFELRCLADVGMPVEIKIVSWYLENRDTVYNNDRYVTIIQNASSGECYGKLISRLQYRHLPWETESDVVVTCLVGLLQSNSELSTQRTAKVSVCYDGSSQRTYSLTKIQMAGLAIAGFLFLFIIISIILLCICCCGRKITVHKRNSLSVAKVQASELSEKY